MIKRYRLMAMQADETGGSAPGSDPAADAGDENINHTVMDQEENQEENQEETEVGHTGCGGNGASNAGGTIDGKSNKGPTAGLGIGGDDVEVDLGLEPDDSDNTG